MTVFLTDGETFIGPYAPGDMAIARGEQELRAHGAKDVYVIRATTLESARAQYHTQSEE